MSLIFMRTLTLNVQGIDMPMKLKDIPRFERQNDISVSVYAWEEGKEEDGELGFVYPLRVSKEVKPQHVNLLLIANDETSHYCWIKNFSRLVSAQYSRNGHELAYCRFCLHGFRGVPSDTISRLEDAKNRRDKHEQECYRHGGQKVSFPDEPICEFTSIEKQVSRFYV